MKVEGMQDTIDWYDKNAAMYADKAEQVAPIEFLNRFVSMLPKDANVLDAGCGSGRDSRILQKSCAEVTGVDISEGMLEEAAKRSNGIKYVRANITELAFPRDHFNGVWAHASLVHLETLEEAKAALAEFARVSAPDSPLHIYVKARMGAEQTAVVSDSLSNHDRFFRYYTEDELRKLVEEAGYGDIEISSTADPHGRKEVTWLALFARKKK